MTIFTACKPSSDNSNNTSDTDSESPKDLVPHLEKRDLDGYTLTFLGEESYREGDYYDCQYNTDETINEPVNDAFFERNRKIESEYNCKIKVLSVGGSDVLTEKIREVIATEVLDFQVAANGITYLAPLASEGHFYDYNTIENSNLKLEGDWWDQAAIRDVSIANVLPFITGDIVVTDNESTWAMFFNKKLIEDNELENPFELVKNNEWTLDKLNEMALAVKRDDGDGIMTVTGNDVWGMVAQTYDGVAFMWGATQAMVTKDAKDLPVFRMGEHENIDAWSKVYELLANQNYTAMADYFYAWNSPDYGIVFDNFIDGKVLFRPASIAFVSSEKMRTSEQLSYGILPMPKYDTTQEEYSSSCTVYGSTFLVIPKILPKSELDNVTYILEAMAYLGKEMVTYQYYDVTLKNKRVQDKDSPEMLELIFKNRTFDLAAIYNWGDALYFYTNIINSKNNNITSQIDASTQKFEEAMKTTIEYFEVITQD